MNEMIHLHSARSIFHSRRGHSENIKIIKTLGGWGFAPDPTGGAYSAPSLVEKGLATLRTALSPSGLATEGPQLTVEPGP